MLPWSAELAGRVDEHIITSELLRGNPLGDPHERPLQVYVPPGYDDEPDRRYPAVYVIQGYTGHVGMWHNRMPWRQPFPELADQVFARGDAPPVIVVYVDAWTAWAAASSSTPRAPAATTPTSATRSCRGWTRTTGRCRTRPPGDQRQVQRRLRRDGHADAPARPLRRAGHARGRRAVRRLLPARLPQRRADAARPLRRVVSTSSWPTSAAGSPAPRTPTSPVIDTAPPRPLLRRRGRHRPAALRRGPGDLRRSGTAGWPGTRYVWRPPRTPRRCAR